MATDVLEPNIELLCQEYVLVQAWKKTATHIRYHNWYSDTLELDRAAVNLPHFLAEISERLKTPQSWVNDPIRIVPAPKSQQWHVTRETNLWEPREKGKTAAKLRPLAHTTLKDQIAATAVMLCLADRVETRQGDPRDPITSAEARKRVISYGNRLFCDAKGDGLRHRWGSGKIYRAYYQDYRKFLERPKVAGEAAITTDDARVVVVHSDLRQFYDRVTPELLISKITSLQEPSDDRQFYDLAHHLFRWEWDRRDSREVAEYARHAGLSDFSLVALPQGLVAAGFFANIALLDFDEGLRASLNQEMEPGIRIEDVCRYVDDLRIVLSVRQNISLNDVEHLTQQWLQGLLEQHAPGLKTSEEKTKAAALRGDERPLVRQSRKMMRIQSAISGGFDAVGGQEILDAVQGLMQSQQRYSEQRTENQSWLFSPIPDVRDATVARFAAGRFRSTYRSLRPLLDNAKEGAIADEEIPDITPLLRTRVARTQLELDDEARAFALGLIENWIEDPSNVRLLRIGLDLWPAVDILTDVLNLLRPFTKKGGRRKAPRRVAWYCLSEIFRAGATETGFVEDGDSLPLGVDIAAYRALLREEAVRLAVLPPKTLPWYLRQQVLLFLAAEAPIQAPLTRPGTSTETKHYRELILFLRGEVDSITSGDFATLAILSRRSFLEREKAVRLVATGITSRRVEQISERDPAFAMEILAFRADLSEKLSPRLRNDLCLVESRDDDGWLSLAELVLNNGQTGPLRNELTILRFASKFLEALSINCEMETITPSDVLIKLSFSSSGIAQVDELKIVPSRVAPSDSMYHPPTWCSVNEHWRFQLGYLLRFILTARQDFTRSVRPPHWREGTATYRVPDSHWYQRLYGMFSGHSAFGDDWLPISDWVERLLFSLLMWPGCSTSEAVEVQRGIEATRGSIDKRVLEIAEKHGAASKLLILPLIAPRPVSSAADRPLRACVVQTVIPMPDDFTSSDLTLSDPAIRKRHRNHLSSALAAIDRMLDLRETHRGRDGRLDWLILPELSVHPRDVRTHLVPFARAHKAIILAGLTYEELFAGQPLVNSALWVIPEWSGEHGLQILIRRQGKQYLAPDEEKLNRGAPVVQGFRPCQWLVGYDWSIDHRPLWLSASICYDATDLCLAADLRHHSDIFAIPALNKDVSTFDQMALALHFHMFQLVIVANNGVFGGSNAYVPYRQTHERQVFHLHGQPQASIGFLEIDDIPSFLTRKDREENSLPTDPTVLRRWKSPPAGM